MSLSPLNVAEEQAQRRLTGANLEMQQKKSYIEGKLVWINCPRPMV
jgi:hypothetical protein